MYNNEKHVKSIVYAICNVFLLCPSALSLWCFIIVGEQVLQAQLPYSWKHKEKKPSSLCNPPLPRPPPASLHKVL